MSRLLRKKTFKPPKTIKGQVDLLNMIEDVILNKWRINQEQLDYLSSNLKNKDILTNTGSSITEIKNNILSIEATLRKGFK